ncbi:MAG: transcription elongation factor GreA [Clostridia bacterium]|nr:transcription elongation factor GreA [Clostridia bacterium]
MSENKEIVLTSEGMQKLKDELEYLRTVRRPEVSEKIKIARGFGDLSENAEYDEAKKEQAEVEEKIQALEQQLKYARVLNEDEIVNDVVGLGSKVKLWDAEYEEEVEYSIVSSTEADLSNNKLSQESPVGKALLGRKKDETVTVNTPGGEVVFKILEITR